MNTISEKNIILQSFDSYEIDFAVKALNVWIFNGKSL